ncbi:hypothetical protein EC970259_B0048 [Escherichia coli 99.0741]|nr:hypothetical protein EC12264_A0004 [Escherichia coli 1.2264]EIH46364.1 hypothetical protein EC970259_B0048 [Escherichia coli 99.0741]
MYSYLCYQRTRSAPGITVKEISEHLLTITTLLLRRLLI